MRPPQGMVKVMSDEQPKIPPELEERLNRLAPFGQATSELINHMHAGGLSANDAFMIMISGACAILAKAPLDLMAEQLPTLGHRMAMITGIYRAVEEVDVSKEVADAVIARHQKQAKS